MEVIAIGDLHGDFYKFKRILEETETLKIIEKDPDNIESLEITPKNIENKIIVFIGDYVDWRKEQLENPSNLDESKLIKGTAKILKTINIIYNTQDLKNKFYFLVGNHEDMMFKALDFIINYYLKIKGKEIPKEIIEKEKEIKEKLENLINLISENPYKIIYESEDPIFSEKYFNFLNWYFQGGKNTIFSFDTPFNFISNILDMKFFKELVLYLKLYLSNELIFFAHTFPDDQEILIKSLNNLENLDKSEELKELKESENIIDDFVINQFLWSRKIWGIDAFNGKYTQPTKFEEIKKIFDDNKIKHFIIGHTKISKNTEPFYHFDGKIISIDLHGIPQSKPLILQNLNISHIKKTNYHSNLLNIFL